MKTIAVTHTVSPHINECELTYMEREEIDYPNALKQHGAYSETLRRCGAEVFNLEENTDHPDSIFVEDNAVVVDEIAVITHMGAESRRAEVDTMADYLAQYREVVRIEAPATIEGGDVMRVGKKVFVGLSTRTNQAGVDALRDKLAPYGYTVTGVATPGCLHLKTGITVLNDETLIGNTGWVDMSAFKDFRVIAAAPDEPWAGNALRVNDKVIMHEGHVRAIEEAEKLGISVERTNISEFMKAEAGLTCMSIVFQKK